MNEFKASELFKKKKRGKRVSLQTKEVSYEKHVCCQNCIMNITYTGSYCFEIDK